KFLGFEAMGYYSIAVLVSSYIQTFYNSIAVVLFPHFQEKFSLQDDPRDLRAFLHKATYAYALTTPILIGLAWIVAPFFIGMVLPQFVPGIAAMKILCFSMFFLALVQPYSDFLITIKKHLILFPLLAATAAVALPLTLWVIHAGYGITGVASVMTFAGFFNFSVTYFFASRYFIDSYAALRKYFKFLGCGAYLSLILLVFSRLFSVAGQSFLGVTAEVLLFLLLYSPLFLILNRKFALTAFVKEKFTRSKAKPELVPPDI
ncbi:MAG: polysaccharide biosynthesis C-terminal domain-containing protein, partial [Candidatus Omnitrophica bacterium]|nr:polysaccharide biosynthesis C-terminal domain-containing protein [Candidatus Omnitrophota bacterium]